MTDCDLSSGRCPLCGFSSDRPIFRNCPAVPQNKPEPPPMGLGDMVKSGLSAIGITEERVSKAIGKPCRCSERAKQLNELGHKYLGLPPGESAASS